MKFPSSFLDEIRARVPVSSVVGRAVQWDRRKSRPGKGDWWACCPFHSEKTPSFHADDRKGRYYCFSCHAKGDVFTFLVEKLGMSFPEAVEDLAAQAGLAMPKPDPAKEKRERERASLADVLAMAAAFYRQQLEGPQGARARDYIAARGLPAQTVERFALGFAPDARDALLRHLQERDVPRQMMLDAGLIGVPDDGRAAYDRFRDRLMFPIRDVRGRVIAFGGRALGEARAKYLNSPETELFHKSRVLYNLDLARKSAFERGEIIAVEGYMDAIAMAQAGFDHVVAPLGTALTEDHLAMLWRTAPVPVLCFDGDAAGQAAAWRALETAMPFLQPGHSLRFAMLPEGMDPDDLLRERGRQAMQEVLDGADSLSRFLWRHVVETSPVSTPEEKAALEKRLEELAGRIRDDKVRAHYRADLRARLRELWQGPRKGGQRPRASGRKWPGAPGPRGASAQLLAAARGGMGSSYHEREILALVLDLPELLDDVAEDLARLEFSSKMLDSLRQKIIDIAAGLSELDSARLKAHLVEEGFGEVVNRLTGASHGPGRHTYKLDLDLHKARRMFSAHALELHGTAVLERELAAAQDAFEQNPTEENFARINRIRDELHAARQTRGE